MESEKNSHSCDCARGISVGEMRDIEYMHKITSECER
jgi:hypothetical protein